MWQLDEDQLSLVDSVTGLVKREFGVAERAADIPEGMPRNYLATFARQGMAGISLPEDVGGQGAGLLEAVLVIEAAAHLHPTAGDAVQALNFGAIQQIARHGSAAIHERFLAPLLRGEKLTAIAMTEPEAGSAVSELATKAVVEGDQVRLNGQKIFTTHGADADFFVVWVRFGEEVSDVGAVIVERDRDGFVVDSSNTFMSGEHYGMLFFDDCLVPAENVLIPDNAFRKLISVFNVERLGNAARSLAVGQAAIDAAIAHARTRVQFGAPLVELQGVQWRLAEATLALESARLLLYRAAAMADSGVPSERETAMAKLACNRAGFAAADTAVQVLGGTGYDSDSIVNYHFRRTRGWLIAGGTAEQMLNRIGRSLVRDARARGSSS